MGGADHRGYYETGKNLPNDAFLTAQAHGAGTIASSDGGINCGATCIHKYPKGTTVTLTATAGSGAVFSRWLGPCAAQANPCNVAVTRYTSVAADFTPKPTLALTLNGGGSVVLVNNGAATVTCTSSCTQPMDPGSQVQLTAVAASGTYFTAWGGDCSGTLNSCSLTMDASKTVSVNFSPKQHVTVAVTGAGHGVIASSDGLLNCPPACVDSVVGGALLTLTANPSSGSTFSGWSGACSGSQPSCTLTLTASKSVGASFAALPGSGNGGGSSGGSSGGGSSGGGGGTLDLLSLVAVARMAASRRALRHHRRGSCYVGRTFRPRVSLE